MCQPEMHTNISVYGYTIKGDYSDLNCCLSSLRGILLNEEFALQDTSSAALIAKGNNLKTQ